MVWDACCSVKFWARKVSEGVEVYAVDGSSDKAENQLYQISNFLSKELRRKKAVLTKPIKVPTICGIEAMLNIFASPEELFVEVGDMMPRLQPLHDGLNAGHAQALSTEHKHYNSSH